MKRTFVIVSQTPTTNGTFCIKLQHTASSTVKSPLGDITQKEQKTFYVFVDEQLPTDTEITIDYNDDTATINDFTFDIVVKEKTFLDDNDNRISRTISYLIPALT